MSLTIAGREIGPGRPTFVVAEISCNHRGSLDLARKLVHAAKDAGADAVKFQAYLPSELAVDSDHPAHVMTEGPWAGRRLFDLYTEARTPLEWLPELFALARELDLIPFASVFGAESLAACEEWRVACEAYKIASAEVADLELVRAIAATGKPVMLSDGMSAAWELMRPVAEVHAITGLRPLVLRCISEYPAAPESYGLRDVTDAYGLIIIDGISDHTLGNEVAIAAVALGACVVEKHLMLEPLEYADPDFPRLLPHLAVATAKFPLDADHSVTPTQFRQYVEAIRRTEAMMQPRKELPQTSNQWRRRLVFARDLPAGHIVNAADIRTARCAYGPEPSERSRLIGTALAYAVKAGDPCGVVLAAA